MVDMVVVWLMLLSLLYVLLLSISESLKGGRMLWSLLAKMCFEKSRHKYLNEQSGSQQASDWNLENPGYPFWCWQQALSMLVKKCTPVFVLKYKKVFDHVLLLSIKEKQTKLA